jgi:5-methylcytosine-specific restriction protein B
MTSTHLVDPANTVTSRTDNNVATATQAAVVIDHMLGDGMSVIDPAVRIWTAKAGRALNAAIGENLMPGDEKTWVKLEAQLSDQPRRVLLLAAEIVFLRDLPHVGIKPDTKVGDVKRVLSWLPEPPGIPAELSGPLLNYPGVFSGGTGYNQSLWRQIRWYARFVARWASLPEDLRQDARCDPWAFHRVVSDDIDDLAMGRNVLLYLAYPLVFEPIINDKNKQSIRNAFAYSVGGEPGDSMEMEAVDRDILSIRAKLTGEQAGPVDFCVDPWRGFWRPPEPGEVDRRAWLVRTGPDGQQAVARWREEGFISLAANHLGRLDAGATKDQVQAAVHEGYEHVDYTQRRALIEDYYAFLTTMSEGDAVVARHDDRAWVGRVVGEPSFADEAPRLRRDVEWAPGEVTVDALPPQAAALPDSPRLVIDLTVVREAIEALFDQVDPILQPTTIPWSRATDELAAEVHISKEWLDEYIDLLKARRQLIVYGPPGTGKTFIAREIAHHVAGADRVSVVQFHPSYAYEDFFEGLRPVTVDGTVSYERSPGPLRRIASAAVEDPSNPYVLIIDEINRADIAKVFGELYYLLEYRGEEVALQYSPDQPFSLPKNLYFIGTMNTADRSIALVDAAIRRRFPFIEMHPSEEPVSGVLASYLESVGASPERADLLAELNGQLTGKLREFQIGPSYLMRDEAATEAGLSRIWRYDILPLLEEQLYGTHDREQVHANFGLDTIRQAVAKKKGRAESEPVLDEEPEA